MNSVLSTDQIQCHGALDRIQAFSYRGLHYYDVPGRLGVSRDLRLHTVVQNVQRSRRKYWATRSSVPSECSLIFLLLIACFARALHCTYSFARWLTHSGALGKEVFSMK